VLRYWLENDVGAAVVVGATVRLEGVVEGAALVGEAVTEGREDGAPRIGGVDGNLVGAAVVGVKVGAKLGVDVVGSTVIGCMLGSTLGQQLGH